MVMVMVIMLVMVMMMKPEGNGDGEDFDISSDIANGIKIMHDDCDYYDSDKNRIL